MLNNIVSALEDELGRAYGILSHLNGVKNSPELRESLEKIQVGYSSCSSIHVAATIILMNAILAPSGETRSFDESIRTKVQRPERLEIIRRME